MQKVITAYLLLVFFAISSCNEEKYNIKKCNKLYNKLKEQQKNFTYLKDVSIYNTRPYIWGIVWPKNALDSLFDKKINQDLQFWFKPASTEDESDRVKMIYIEETKKDYRKLFELSEKYIYELEKRATPIVISHYKIGNINTKGVGNSILFYSSPDSIGLLYNFLPGNIDTCIQISPKWYYFNNSVKIDEKLKHKIEKRIKDKIN